MLIFRKKGIIPKNLDDWKKNQTEYDRRILIIQKTSGVGSENFAIWKKNKQTKAEKFCIWTSSEQKKTEESEKIERNIWRFCLLKKRNRI